MTKSKRKKGSSSGSESQDNPFKDSVNKAKHLKTDDLQSVSEILNQTSSVLYDSVASKSDKQNPDHDVSNKFDSLINAVKELKTSQHSMKRMFELKLDKLRTDLMANVDNKVRALRDEISIDISRETNRTDSLEQDTSSKNSVPLLFNPLYQTQNHLDNLDITITAGGLPFSEDENLIEKANDLIRALGEDVSDNVIVTTAARLPSRFSDRPAIVKISFRNLDEKKFQRLTTKDIVDNNNLQGLIGDKSKLPDNSVITCEFEVTRCNLVNKTETANQSNTHTRPRLDRIPLDFTSSDLLPQTVLNLIGQIEHSRETQENVDKI
ncbi:unnamed protein product [Mytilus coruscus]|uniref:Uncharacterized protein n=1 Tax=Mytilus coruscus TaxID=42192 RepID=A0A6J8DAB7_MYTCO|nr:unnamed protein product [Mytilus coruscus]